MAVTSRNLRTSAAQRTSRARTMTSSTAQRVSQPRSSSMRIATMILLGSIVLVNVILTPALSWGRTKLDDLRYGRPRTVQMTAHVGHAAAGGLPSHFVALNLERRVVILELPGGDVAHMRTIVGPYLFGADEDLTPVLLRFADVNADQRLDMVVNVKQEEIVYINDLQSNSFRIITADELVQLQPR